MPEACQAGNRACCARAADCVGVLDDQTVETTRTDCVDAAEDQCWPPCDADDASFFDLCLGMGTSDGLCAIGDDECCALAADCLGELGDVIVYADGCCASIDDCERGERCDSAGSCVVGSGCGDGVTSGSEACDDGNDATEACDYGAMSCVVCGAGCTQQSGAPNYCGDGDIDAAEGEACEPPSTSACDAGCQSLSVPTQCSNDVIDGTETDVDCGGRECPPCGAGLFCGTARDCADGDACTTDTCDVELGCSFPIIDADSDTFGPLDIGCGTDCDDTDPNVAPGILELCDGFDQDCDDLIDESCTST